MSEFYFNTIAIKENIKTLKNNSTYYAKKKDTFTSGAFNSGGCAVGSYLNKINMTYAKIANNTNNLIKYLENYADDIENIENVMSNTGYGNISVSAASTKVFQNRNRMKKYNIPDEDIFPINTVDASSLASANSGIAVNVDNPFGRVNSSGKTNIGNAMPGFNTAVFGFDHVKREGNSAEYKEMCLGDYESWIEKVNSGDISAFSLGKLDLNKILDGYIFSIQNQIDLFQPLLDDVNKKIEARDELESRYSEIEDWQNQYEVNLRERAGQYRQGVISEEKIKELGLDKYNFNKTTYTYDLTIDEMVEIIKEKDSETIAAYRELNQTKKELDADTERLTGYTTYAEFASNFEKLEQDQYITSATIKKLESQMAMAPYTLLPFLDDYQNYKNSDDIKTPLEKVGAFSSDKVKNLAEAIEVNEDYAEMGNIYNYLYETEGEKAANEYLNAIEDSVNQILGQKKANEFLESLSGETKTIINENGEEETIRVFSDSALTSISDHLKITGKGLGEGVQSFGEGLAAWIKSSDVYSADEYERMYILEALSKGENSFLYSNNFEISQSIGNMAPTIALSIVLSSTGVGEAYAAGAAGAAMGTSAGGNSYHQALVEGYSQGQSIMYGALNGLSEAGLEMVIGGLTGISDVKVTNFLTYLQASAKEGNEEALQEVVDAISRKAIFGEDIEWSDTFKAALKSGAYGAITADILNGASLTVNAGISGINSYLNSNVNSFNQIVNTKNMISERYKNLHQEQLNAIKDGTINKIKGIPNQVKETAQKYANNFNEFREHLNNRFENDVNNSVDCLIIEDLNYNTNNGKLTNLGNVLLSNLKKYVYTNTNKFNGLNEKIQEEGLYHFADENTIDKIFDSQTIKASGLNASYGTPKSFFFAGVPSVGAYATNLDSIPLTTTAVKVVPTDNSINSSKFKVRNLDDAAISYNGNFDLNNAISTKEYFALKLENNELVYQKVSKEEYENYANTEEGQKIADFLKDKKNIQAIKNDYFNKLAQKLDGGHLLNELNETIETLEVDNVADNTVEKVEEINTNTTNNISEEAKQAFEKLQMFFDTDLKVKEIMSDNAPNAAYQYNQEYISQYSDNLLEMIKDLKFYFKKMSKVIDISDTYINDLFNNYEIQLAECGLNFNKLKKFYNDYISDMSDNIINLTRENFAGYSIDAKEAFSSVLGEAKTVNEVLHVLHSYITNDNDMYTSMPTVDSKTNSNQESITLYGEDNEIARSFFNSFPTNEDSNITDIISLKNKLLVMVRDRGHALTIEINYDENGKAYIDYFIPKICNADKVNKLTGVRKVPSDAPANAFTTGYFETTLDNLNNDIYNFIKSVPTDDDMVFPEFDEIDAPAENDISQVTENSTESTMERVKLSNEKTLTTTDFTNLSTEEQIDYITNANREQLDDILKDINVSSIDSKVVNEIENKIIANQDIIFSRWDSMNTMYIKPFVQNNPNLLTKLSNASLISLLNRDAVNVLEELNNRINKGENILDFQNYKHKFMGLEMNDVNALNPLVNKYDTATAKIIENIKAKLALLPEDVKELSLKNKDVVSQSYFIEEYLNGDIDQKGLDLMNELLTENPNRIEKMNFALLNQKYIDTLSQDYIKSIINDYETSSKLVTLNTKYPNLYNSFVKILNDFQNDNSLYTFYAKANIVLDFIYNNADKFTNLNSDILENDNFVNYAIYMSNRSMINTIEINEYSADYEIELNQKCDEQFSNLIQEINNSSAPELYMSYNLEKMKDCYFTKYFSLPYNKVKDLITKYKESITAISQNDPHSTTILEYLEYIASINDYEKLNDIYQNQTFKLSSEEMLYLDDSLRKAYVKTYVDKLGTTSNYINNEIIENSSLVETLNYNGHEIKMLNLNDDFAFIVRSSESGLVVENRELAEDSYKKSWAYTDDASNHLLAASYITSENIGSCPVNGTGVLYGFTNIQEDDLMMMGPADINSNINNVGYGSGQQQRFVSADEMSNYTTRIYNEFVLEKSNVKPDCIIVYTDFSPELMNNAYKAAAEWNIPIIKIDKTQLAENNNQKINNHLNEFSQTKNLEELESALNLYESNVSGFKLNTYVEEGKTDVTSSIDNSYIKELGLFDSKQIETNLQQALDYFKTLDNNSEMVDNYIEILKQVQYKYNITNDMSNSLLANSKSDIDYNAYIEEALKIRK